MSRIARARAAAPGARPSVATKPAMPHMSGGRKGKRGRYGHAANLSKAGATKIQKMRRDLPSARLYDGSKWKLAAREWKRVTSLVGVETVPAFEHHQLPQT